MRNLFSALMIAAAAVVMAIDSRMSESANEPTAANLATMAAPAMFPECCNCTPCECKDCQCEPLAVGRPPDVLQLVNLAGGNLTTEVSTAASPPGLVIAEPSRNTPPPGLVIPISKPAEPAPTNQPATGHWETRNVGLRGRRTQTYWIPHNNAAAGGAPAAACNFAGGACRSCR